MLRDTVHTTDYGSNMYANIISNFVINKLDQTKKPKIINITEFINIRQVEINGEFNKVLKLSGECEIIGFLLTVGPHSGIVKIIKKNATYKENTWDRYCSYNRKNFKLAMSLSGNAELIILQDPFDTSLCKKKKNYLKFRKKLIIHSIFYIGKRLSIENYCEGKLINYKIIYIINIIEKVKYRASIIAKKLFRLNG